MLRYVHMRHIHRTAGAAGSDGVSGAVSGAVSSCAISGAAGCMRSLTRVTERCWLLDTTRGVGTRSFRFASVGSSSLPDGMVGSTRCRIGAAAPPSWRKLLVPRNF